MMNAAQVEAFGIPVSADKTNRLSGQRLRKASRAAVLICALLLPACVRDRDNVYVGGGAFLSSPIGLSLSTCLMTAEPGLVLQAEAGSFGGKMSVGMGVVDGEAGASFPYSALTTSLAVIRTWNDPRSLPEGADYLGLEFKFYTMFSPSFFVGRYKQVGGPEARTWLWVAGIGYGY